MRKKELTTLSKKRIKSALAASLAVVLSVPTAVVINNVSVSGSTLPSPIAVYKMDNTDGMTTVGENAPSVVDDATRGKVVEMGTATSSAITMDNPFAGRTILCEYPTFTKTGTPIWESGVTVSYWVKAAEKESSLFSFNLSKENVVQKDDKIKMQLLQRYLDNPTDPLFSIGTEEEVTLSDGKYNGILVANADRSKTYKLRTGIGMFARFNQDYDYNDAEDATDNAFFLQAVSWNTDGTAKKYNINPIGEKITVEQYGSITGDKSKVKYGTEESGLQFNASGAWGFIEGDADTQLYTNGVKGETGALNGGNNAFTQAYTGTADTKEYADVSPLKSAGTWHYVTNVIKNDSISTYIDGVLSDTDLYKNVYANKAFNLAYGYYTSTSDSGLIHNSQATTCHTIDSNLATPENGKFWFPEYKNATYPNKATQDMTILGANGNTVTRTIMEIITDPDSKIQLGGNAYSVGSWDFIGTGCYAGTCVDSIAFYTEPLDASQVTELYNLAKTSDPEAVDQPIQTQTPTTKPGPSEDVTPTPSTDVTPGPSTDPSATPVPSVDPSTAPSTDPSATPSTDPSATPSTTPNPSVVMGDVNGDKDITLEDANIVLKAALKIQTLTGDNLTAADVDGNGSIELSDANLVLKRALKIISSFK